MSVQTEIQPISMLSRPERRRDTVRRILWIVNHKTLMSGEVPLPRSLGFEVFVLKFQGLVIARAFGRESPLTCGEFRTWVPHPSGNSAWGETSLCTPTLNGAGGQ
jgi:hypothetical protein